MLNYPRRSLGNDLSLGDGFWLSTGLIAEIPCSELASTWGIGQLLTLLMKVL
jgi:hypothetical protein